MSIATETAEKAHTAAEIRKDLTVNEKGKTEFPDDLYEKHLPDGITRDTVNRIRAHERAFFPAAFAAFGEAAESALQKHKDLDRASLHLPAGDGAHFQAQYAREVKRAVKGEDGKVGSETTYGALSCKFVVNGGDGSNYRSIQERFATQAKKLFAE